MYRAKIDAKGEYEAWDYALVRSMLDEITAVYDYHRRSAYAGKDPFEDISHEEYTHLGEFNAALVRYYLKNPGIGKYYFSGVREYCDRNGISEGDELYAFCKLADSVVQRMRRKGKF